MSVHSFWNFPSLLLDAQIPITQVDMGLVQVFYGRNEFILAS